MVIPSFDTTDSVKLLFAAASVMTTLALSGSLAAVKLFVPFTSVRLVSAVIAGSVNATVISVVAPSSVVKVSVGVPLNGNVWLACNVIVCVVPLPDESVRKPASDLAASVVGTSVVSVMDWLAALYKVAVVPLNVFRPLSVVLLLTVAAGGTVVTTSTSIVFVASSMLVIVN